MGSRARTVARSPRRWPSCKPLLNGNALSCNETTKTLAMDVLDDTVALPPARTIKEAPALCRLSQAWRGQGSARGASRYRAQRQLADVLRRGPRVTVQAVPRPAHSERRASRIARETTHRSRRLAC